MTQPDLAMIARCGMGRTILQGKTALVTGATKLIGREIALALAEAGVNVAVHHMDSPTGAEELATQLRERGVKAWSFGADLADLDQTEQLLSKVIASTGNLDILVNNASIFHPNTIHDLDFAGLALHMQVNAWAPLVLSRHFARHTSAGNILSLVDTGISGSDSAHLSYILSKQDANWAHKSDGARVRS